MVKLSPTAQEEIQRLLSKQQQKPCLRLAIKPGGCHELYYDMSFVENPEPGDRLFESQNTQILIDEQSYSYVHDLVIDYSQDLMGGAFRFHNPQAKITCGCGNSFSVGQ
ncbi:HesB/IscA family protein [Calothrix sp. 336/3]|uniref:HesB/IscA family protein n=1 Tax=Calothrix sp. 336/3 TaxID=1337936 RepID=UPI0004E33F99|nr:iron-sulfur cluster assembly accessory protein [Calothrix sp. 336/3]AKG23120.1 hypothetical protein IJ00_19230 [Calothrix sp. 336/3]